MEFLSHLKKYYCTFDKILEEAKASISKIDERQRQKIKEELNHGIAIIDKSYQMAVYMEAYGAIHKSKLDLAFERLPHKLYSEGKLSIIDYSCGQGIATIAFAEHLSNHYQDVDIIKEVLLIEPSAVCLDRAFDNVRRFLPYTKIEKLNNYTDKFWNQQINLSSDVIIHLLSNVIDLPEFPREIVADRLNEADSHNNIVIIVGPFYPENGRGKYVDIFGAHLTNYTCAYSFEKHTDEWDNDFSCQIRIYISKFY